MKKQILALGMAVLISAMTHGASALEVLTFNGDFSKYGTFTDTRPDKKTQISYESSTDEKYGKILKVKYNLDKDSYCGLYIHSLNQKWYGAKSVDVVIRGTQDSTIRISFLDANKVSYVYDLKLTSDWQTLSAPIDGFKKNPYYQPEDAKKDKPMNISKVQQIQFEPQTSGNGIFYVANVEAKGVVPLNDDKGVPKTSTAKPKVYENFRSKKLVGNYTYANEKGGASIAVVLKKKVHPRSKRVRYFLEASFNSGAGDYGCGVGLIGLNTDAGKKPFNAAGHAGMEVAARFPKDVKFRVSITETDENDGEKWTSPWLQGAGETKMYAMKLNDFEKNAYVGKQDGNEKMNLDSIKNIDIEIGPNQGTGMLELNLIRFN